MTWSRASSFETSVVDLHRFDELVADPVHRMEPRERILEDHRELLAADLLQLLARHREQVAPLKRISPSIVADLRVMRPSAVRHVTLLPEPDSPTIPNVSPRRTSNESPSTALTMPSGVGKCTLRSRTSRSGSPSRLNAHEYRTLGSRYA